MMQSRGPITKPRPPTAEEVWQALAEIPDPEIADTSLVDLGVIKSVTVDGPRVRVEFTPTFMGCPALERMQVEMTAAIERAGGTAGVVAVRADPWSTDRITPEGREKLRLAGFAPPAPRPAGKLDLVELQRGAFRCPYCGSTDTQLENLLRPPPFPLIPLRQLLPPAVRAVQDDLTPGPHVPGAESSFRPTGGQGGRRVIYQLACE